MPDHDYDSPGTATSVARKAAADIQALHAQRTAANLQSWSLTPKGRAVIQGANIGSRLPDDATDRQ